MNELFVLFWTMGRIKSLGQESKGRGIYWHEPGADRSQTQPCVLTPITSSTGTLIWPAPHCCSVSTTAVWQGRLNRMWMFPKPRPSLRPVFLSTFYPLVNNLLGGPDIQRKFNVILRVIQKLFLQDIHLLNFNWQNMSRIKILKTTMS
jgi:hypothetical protein